MSGQKRHVWSVPDENAVRSCLKEGCAVRVANHFRAWQRKKGAHWRLQERELIPECQGKEPR